jgi:iron(III) transport system ATP-binding protein
MIAGLEMASEGQILIGGRDVTRLSAAERDVSMVFQSYALFPHMSVLENVCYGPRMRGASRADAEKQALAKLDLIGLKGYEKRMPSELSGGQQQRVAVARALVLEPQVLLFDEPLSNLDAKLRRRVREDIRDLQRNLNLTVAYVTHDQEEALAVSDQIIVMSNARIAQTGTPRDLYEAPASRFVAEFIGDSNLVDASILSVSGERAQVMLGPLKLDLPNRGMPPGAVKLALRPEALGIDAPGKGIAAKIAKAAYLGKHMEYTLQTDIGELFVVARDVTTPYRAGDSVSVIATERGTTVVPV